MRKLFLSSYLAALVTLTAVASAQETIIDSHTHIMPPGLERGLNPKVDATPEELRRQMAEAGVDKAAVFAMVQKGQPKAMREYNDYILDLARNSDDFFGVASVHPLDGEVAVDEVARVAQKGAKALKLHPFFQKFEIDDPGVLAVVKAAGENGLAVIFDSINAKDGGATGKFVDLAIANPDTKIILAHMGGYRFDEMILFAVFAKGPFYKNNVYFDLSAIAQIYSGGGKGPIKVSPRKEELAWTIREIGIDQFLFGSDFPIYDLKSSREAVERYGFTEEELKKLYHDNAVKVFGLE